MGSSVSYTHLDVYKRQGINMFQSANYYYVEYTNINGLAGSSPVFANGYKVGTVRNINYN